MLPELGFSQDFGYADNGDGTATITGYSGSSSVVAIPDTIGELKVVSIGGGAFEGNAVITSVTMGGNVKSIGYHTFYECYNLTALALGTNVESIGSGAFTRCFALTNFALPGSLTSIAEHAFNQCKSLTMVNIPEGITSIGDHVFFANVSLTNVTIPNSVTYIGPYAFWNCISLPKIIIPASVTSLGEYAFISCTSLTGAYFRGDAPKANYTEFWDDHNVTVYHLPGTTGWGATFADRPTALWVPQLQTGDGSFGVHAGRFGFNVTGPAGMSFVVEACTDPGKLTWQPISTNTISGDASYFNDANWADYSDRFYRLRQP